MTDAQIHDLCLALLTAESEADVIGLLKHEGYWEDPNVWRYYGDQSENWATVGNQQSRAEQAFIEKIMNSIDTKLLAAACINNVPLTGDSAPSSVFEARNLLFADELKDMERLSRSITVAATGKRTRPSITIADDGEGQHAGHNPLAPQGQ
jgi:hypothetical protein